MQDFFKTFENLAVPNFPDCHSAIYVVFCKRGHQEIPIYVGETGRLRRRIGDYIVASFQASTDFKVGEAVRYLQEKGYAIVVKYKGTEEGNRREEETRVREYLEGKGYKLLHSLKGL